MDSKNEWLLLSGSFTAKFQLVFVFQFQADRKSIGSSETGVMWQSVEILNDFNTLTSKQILWKTETFFKKTGVPFFSWKYKDWKRIISMQNCYVRSQC